MKKEDLETRIANITKETDQAFAVYHKLLGHLNEAKFILDDMVKEEILAKGEAQTSEVETVDDISKLM